MTEPQKPATEFFYGDEHELPSDPLGVWCNYSYESANKIGHVEITGWHANMSYDPCSDPIRFKRQDMPDDVLRFPEETLGVISLASLANSECKITGPTEKMIDFGCTYYTYEQATQLGMLYDPDGRLAASQRETRMVIDGRTIVWKGRAAPKNDEPQPCLIIDAGSQG